MKSIVLVTCYFGNWPPWMAYFLKSCGKNPTVNWLIVSDQSYHSAVPPNVIIENFSLNDFNVLASDKLSLNINVKHPYKLCDFRPAYRVIFDDYLSKYDYWGYCDLDVIFGDVRAFITNGILEKYDVISGRKEYMAGHFSLFRNTNSINNLFRLCPMIDTILETGDIHYTFDENFNPNGMDLNHLFIEKIKLKFRRMRTRLAFIEHWIHKPGPSPTNNNHDSSSDKNDITSIVKFCQIKGELKAYFKTMVFSKVRYRFEGIKNWSVTWDNGKIMEDNSNKEALYFHFISLKDQRNFTIPPFRNNITMFKINKSGIAL